MPGASVPGESFSRSCCVSGESAPSAITLHLPHLPRPPQGKLTDTPAAWMAASSVVPGSTATARRSFPLITCTFAICVYPLLSLRRPGLARPGRRAAPGC